MRFGSLHRIGLSLGVAAAIGSGAAYVSGNYLQGNYTQPGSYAGGTHVIDSAIDAAIPVLSVAITDSADPVITGADAYSYAVTLTNSGAAAATTVSVATTLDAGLAYVSSSGTGWVCSATGQVVTCTAASIGNGVAPAITINVTTGTSALSASSSVVASASNASNATASQGTTVQLVSKDATAGVYLPASSTEWTNFIARKGLSIAVPDAIWLFQEASGNLTDSGSSGLFGLTAAGTGLAYQQAVAGWTRKAITFTDGGTGQFKSTSASLPDVSLSSQTTMVLAAVTATPAAARNIVSQGNTTKAQLIVTITPRLRASSGANVADGTASPIASTVKPWTLRQNVTAAATTGFSNAEKLTPTYGTPSGKTACIGANASNSPAMAAVYGAEWHGGGAEVSDANLKLVEQAMGFTITWN